MWKEIFMWNSSLLPLDMGMCMLWILLLKIFGSSSSSSLPFLLSLLLFVHSMELEFHMDYISTSAWNLSLKRLKFLHWTRASKAQDAILLKYFENMSTNEIVTKIMFNGKIPPSSLLVILFILVTLFHLILHSYISSYFYLRY